jgi:hypothetical protein
MTKEIGRERKMKEFLVREGPSYSHIFCARKSNDKGSQRFLVNRP